MLSLQKYKYLADDSNLSVPSEPSSPQSSSRSRSPSPDDILERVAADVKEYERENVDTFEASVKAKHNLMAVEQNNGELGFCDWALLPGCSAPSLHPEERLFAAGEGKETRNAVLRIPQ